MTHHSFIECIGYTKVGLTIDVYTDSGIWDSISDSTYPVSKFGVDVDIVAYNGGIVRSFPGDPIIRALPSFRTISWDAKIGEYWPITIDCFTRQDSSPIGNCVYRWTLYVKNSSFAWGKVEFNRGETPVLRITFTGNGKCKSFNIIATATQK